ncbi:MAG: ATP-dependent helicase HrpB [Flammeovirgaceae bacterium]|nr:MAG: ATP-dependent helicase HrpB [Flammeovirgaceae bacterium]
MEVTYPVHDVLPVLKEQLHNQSVVILQAPPGAGKSTVVPLALMGDSWLAGKKIIMLEPRRLAARSVAMRMASLLNEEIGDRVGYRIRFDAKVSARTEIEVVTEGILTRMLQKDNALTHVGLVIFDEFHERSLQADLALALCLQVQSILRPDLRILIMSATLDAEKLSAQLNNAPVISSTGKAYPVEIFYLGDDQHTPLPVKMVKAVRKALAVHSGDILCFLPGTGEIKRTMELLEAEKIQALVVPLYGELSFTLQQRAIEPDAQGRRKIVLATSIAETSLTIEGITMVIDSGLSRVPKFDPRSGLTRLETVRVTRDAADQRAGRAGRLTAGTCYRLWSEATQRSLVAQRKPEILEADLASLVLELAAWGIHDLNNINWITPPPAGATQQASDLLVKLEALEENRITDWGRKMVALPTHPRLAHMLTAVDHDKRRRALATDIAALLEERDPLINERSADLSLRVDQLRKWRSGDLAGADRMLLERIERLAKAWRNLFSLDVDNTSVSEGEVGALLALAYPERIAQRVNKHSERYKLTNGRVASLPAHDPLMHAEWIVAAQLDAGTGEGKIFLGSAINEEDLMRFVQTVDVVRWDKERGLVEGVQEKRIGNLVVAKKTMPAGNNQARAAILCKVVQEEGLRVLNWQEVHTQWQNRVLSLRLWRPDDGWPDVSDKALLENVSSWLTPFVNVANSRTDLQRIDISEVLPALLPWELQTKLGKLTPVKLEVPSGSLIPVNYFSNGQPPVMEVRLQEVFGWPDTPTVNDGRIKITMHLLSPGYKPVQVTQDLRSFWNTTYYEVKKELKRRYPKHAWPDDPWTAKAVRGVVKRR